MSGTHAGAVKGWQTRKRRRFGGSTLHTRKRTMTVEQHKPTRKRLPALQLVAPSKAKAPAKPKKSATARKSSAGYERWKAAFESAPKRFPIGGSGSAMLEMNRLSQANPRYMRRYLKEHPVIDKHGRFL